MNVFTRKSLSLFAAVGGWRTVAEAVASKVVFLLAYQVSGQVLTSALVAVGSVLAFAVVRIWSDRSYWSAAIGLVVVGVSTLLAGSTGHAVDFYLEVVVTEAGLTAVLLLSILARWPLVGLVAGGLRGERLRWRRDRTQRRRYQLCTLIFLAKCALATAVLVPLYLAGALTPLGIASTLLQTPAAGVCLYICWRILRRAEV
ncbi:DUF3159 domain-containing protein [Fodinicola acaciae]|uniref:DUF3159 domain-containing protein n=1 Tax=Fodinicola acaciae TaxID=2681555 RepID=UPI0013D577C6|nr:DUF3159 domain-containing protein [Fodinicola acaciae]